MESKQPLTEITENIEDDNDLEQAEYDLHLSRRLEIAEEEIRQGLTYSLEEAKTYLKNCRIKRRQDHDTPPAT